MNRQYISWTDFGSMMDRLIHQVRQPSTQFTKVIGIARGGIIPAGIIALKLNLPIELLYYSSKESNGDGKVNSRIPPDWYLTFNFNRV